LAGVSYAAHPERFRELSRVYVGGEPFELESVWYHRDEPVFKFKGVDSISSAEALAGSDVTIPEAERPPLAGDEFYLSDLIGCTLVDDGTGRPVGVVTGWEETGGPLVLEVDRGRVLVPFAKSIVKKIDPVGREIRAQLPEGLEDLNNPRSAP
jgi:16S rRNA processing protein RimM